MYDGFIKVGAATPHVAVADPEYNSGRIMEQIGVMAEEGVKVMVFPELCLSAYTCGDLFLHESLLKECLIQLKRIAEGTVDVDAIIFLGVPLESAGKLYNCAVALNKGKVLGVVPKLFLPGYSEFYESRQFTPGFKKVRTIELFGKEVYFGADIIFENDAAGGLKIACEICEDAWVAKAPSADHALNGADIIVNLSASDELIGKDDYRRQLIKTSSAKLVCGYIYAGAGDGESTQDLVFGGHSLIAENGVLLSESKLFENGIITADIDIGRLLSDRRRMNTFTADPAEGEGYEHIRFELKKEETRLTRSFPSAPFVPQSDEDRKRRCESIFDIQSVGLKKRYEHTGLKDAVIGLSGGLDSTLALLVTVRVFDSLKLSRSGIHAVTMPCFGTTDRTYNNACTLAERLGVTLKEVDIKNAVRQHFSDIGQDENVHDVTYENSQARERTQVLMDIANMVNGLVIGTGDMSELALGWATYNGDHMSMYDVNAGVPKTLVRHLVVYCADKAEGDGDRELCEVLRSIVDTPVSPELLPAENGIILQKTEELVGPYELHDFFLYYTLRFAFGPKKIYRMACHAFDGRYDGDTVKKWMKTFFKRFFSQQFKRSCLPDGPKVGTAALSPRGDLRMPSDASSTLWLKEIEEL